MLKSIYPKDQVELVAKLVKARLEAKLSQEEVTQKIGKTQSYISKIESGQRRIDVVQLKDFSIIYKKNLAYFLENE